MKIYRLILVLGEGLTKGLNKNVESTTSEMKAKILGSYKPSQVFQTSREDILIGEEVNSERFVERMNYFIHLSKDRLGKLELILCSPSEDDTYIRLFNDLIKSSRLEELVAQLEKDFVFGIKHVKCLESTLIQEKKKFVSYNAEEFDTNLAMLKAYNALIEKRP